MWKGIVKVQARRAPGRHRPRDPELRREPGLLGRARVLRPRHRPAVSTKSRRCCTTAAPARSKSSVPGMIFTIEPMINAGRARDPRAGRRLDHRHARPFAVGAVGAHGAASPRPATRCSRVSAGSPAAAGVRRAPMPCRPPWPAAEPIRRLSRLARDMSALADRHPRGGRGRAAHAVPRRQGRAGRSASAGAPHRAGRRAAHARAGAPRRSTHSRELWLRSAMPPGAALVAVGGYGRGELFPHSDVDVLVLLPGSSEDDHRGQRCAARRGRAASSPRAGTSGSRSARRCARSTSASTRRKADVTVQTALLEVALARRLASGCIARSSRPPMRRWTRRPSCAPRRSRCASAT